MQKIYLHIILFSFLLTPLTSQSQDLIANASFERCNLCPTKLGSFDQDVVFWSAPTLGSTDYFNSCSPLMGTPENFNGKQPAQNGTAYAGFYLYAPQDYREYLQTRLGGALIKDREYHLTFYISRAEGSDFAIREIGVLLADRELNVETKKTLSKKHWFASGIRNYNYFEINKNGFWQQTRKWVKLEVKFRAKGNEEYLIIGNFKPNAKTRVRETVRTAKKGAYYYIDSFSLVPLEKEVVDNGPADDPLVGEPLALNTTHRFQNVLFEFDRFVLLETAKSDIRKVYDYLNKYSDLNIHIDGHTDNVGAPAYNTALSGYRCKAVVQYLEQLGLNQDRISWRAHGGKTPIADNTTDEGRKLNRRVEFVLNRQTPPSGKNK
jgi:outer membrane protein OmpA-like peptidoglycan-associated protein